MNDQSKSALLALLVGVFGFVLGQLIKLPVPSTQIRTQRIEVSERLRQRCEVSHLTDAGTELYVCTVPDCRCLEE